MIKFDPKLSRSQSKRENTVDYLILLIRKKEVSNFFRKTSIPGS